ncbi:MAG TPA: TIM barrel protein [Vicinamibacterales bacterium]|jgi:sugar phosphate isomerase/epimerase
MTLTRRELGKILLTVPAAGLLANQRLAAAFGAKPDSKWGGVQVGMNVPYNYGTRTMAVDEIIDRTSRLGVSAVELRSQPIELALGAPMSMIAPGGDKAAQQQAAEHLRAWRLALDPDKAAAVRKQFDGAGISTDVIKFDGIYDFSDPELDYAFRLAKAMDARAISCELELPGSKRVGQFADKHSLMVGYHGHTKTTEAMFKEAFSYAQHNGANLDIGHYIAGNLGNPLGFIRDHHERITHIHVKDRKAGVNGVDGVNVPFGQGDTPITAALQLIRRNGWPIEATIEFEYKVPDGSDAMTELAKCVGFCKNALTSQ